MTLPHFHFDDRPCVTEHCKKPHQGDVIPVVPPEAAESDDDNGLVIKTVQMPKVYFVASLSHSGYWVQVTKGKGCSCPAVLHEGFWCRHLKAVAEWESWFLAGKYDRPAPPAVNAMCD